MKLITKEPMKLILSQTLLKGLTVSIVFLLMILQSCTKESTEVQGTNGEGNVEISISGVEDEPTFTINESEIEDKIARASIARQNIFSEDSDQETYDIQTLPEFDVLSDIQSSLTSSSSAINIIDSNVVSKTSKATSKAKKESSKAITRMAAQTRYRIIFYQQGSTDVASNQVAAAGNATQATLDAGKTYNWYAVSINSTTVPDINASGVIARSGLTNRDVLYASGVITPVFGANTLQITFRRRTARIEVDLNVRGLFGRIRNTTSLEIGWRSGTSFNSVFQMGDLNIRTGDYTNITNSPAVTGANMTNTATNTGDAVKKAIFHTVRNNNIANNVLTVRLNRLDLTMDDGSVRSFNTSTLVPIPGTMNPNYGSRFVINARLIESPTVVNSGRFARTNLIYDPASGQVDRYRFRPHNNYGKPNYANEYWRWRASTPTGTPNTTDPCGSVYPSGVWAGPAPSHFSALGINAPVLSSRVDGVERIARTWTQTGNAAGNSSGYPNNNLQLLYLGFYTPNGVLQNAAENLGTGVGTASGDYWTNVASTGTDAGVARYRVTQDANNVITHHALSMDLYARNARRPYRCVRY